MIDGSELARYQEVNGHRFRSETVSGEQPETSVGTVAELRAPVRRTGFIFVDRSARHRAALNPS